MRARLTVSGGIASPRQCELDGAGSISIGRNRENDLVLHDRHASRFHARVYASNGQWFLRDEGTTNGTRLDGERVVGERPLEDGQEIFIGEVRIRFQVDGSKTDEFRVADLPDEPQLVVAESMATVLQVDELTTLFRFLEEALEQVTSNRLVRLALEAVHRQMPADLIGFLGLEGDDPDVHLVLPERASLDKRLSRQLTQTVLSEGRSVWLGASSDTRVESESLSAFRDALCIPLRVHSLASQPDGHPEVRGAPLGALHVYRSHRPFIEREVRFCEVLAGCLASTLSAVRTRQALEADNSRLRVRAAGGADAMVGTSPAIRELREQIARLSDAPCTVLVMGESGAGKELVALGLHRQSRRGSGPLIPVNCAAVTGSLLESQLFGHRKGSFTGALADHPGFFLQADLGTLFLDEIGELPPELQPKLLRAIEHKRFLPVGALAEVKADVRIIAATNRDLEKEVREGRFRTDLFYRLNITTIRVPPLRDRREDVPQLAQHFLDHFNAEYRRRVSLSGAALSRLQAYSWPGNIRQLRSVIEACVAMTLGDALIGPADLRLTEEAGSVAEVARQALAVSAPGPAAPPPAVLNLGELEAWAIQQAMERTGGNKTQAARVLGIHRDTLINKLSNKTKERTEGRS